MEVLRFGSSICGEYHGCCAIDIIQSFSVDPDAPKSIQIVNGDSGSPVQNPSGEGLYAGTTEREVFETRMRIGTFSSAEMPNHVFLASMTGEQCRSETGKKWLEILKAHGFEFIRATDNSVYSGNDLNGTRYRQPVYLFGLFRNIGKARLDNPFQPPEEWTNLPSVLPEPAISISGGSTTVAKEQSKAHEKLWKAGKTRLLTEAEIVAAGVPVMLAGKKGEKPSVKTPAEVKTESFLKTL